MARVGKEFLVVGKNAHLVFAGDYKFHYPIKDKTYEQHAHHSTSDGAAEYARSTAYGTPFTGRGVLLQCTYTHSPFV